MSTLLQRIGRSPRLSRVVIAVSAPAFITLFFAPPWAIACSLIVAVGAVVFIYAEVLSPKYVQQSRSTKGHKHSTANKSHSNGSEKVGGDSPALAPDTAARSNNRKHPSDSQNAREALGLASVSGAHEFLNKEWSNYAWTTLSSSNSAQNEIRSVINFSTQSALALATSIRELERNHGTQNHLAKNLLASTSASTHQQASLSDLALVASTILERQNHQLMDTAEQATRLIEKQQSAMLIASRADDLLGEADKAARQLALNVMGSGTTLDGLAESHVAPSKIIDPWAFVQNHRTTLKELRSDLEEIRRALSQVSLDLQSSVNSLRHTAQKESVEVASVNASIQQKLEETRSTVNALNELSKDTDSHIQTSIVAMQYHDIMTQKLGAVDTLYLESIALRTQKLIQGSTPAPTPQSVASLKHDASPVDLIDLKNSNEVDLFV